MSDDWRSRATPIAAGADWRSRAQSVPSDAGEAEDDGPSELESGLRGAAQGATLGFADELAGAGSALADKLKGDNRDLGDLYKLERDDSRAKFHAAQEANPLTYGAGQIGGGVLSQAGLAALTGGTSLGALAAQGAIAGGLQGLGDSESQSLTGDLGNAAVGAGAGGAMGAAGGLLGNLGGAALKKVAPELAEKLESLAQMQAYRAAGPTLRDFREVGADGAKAVGKKLLDEGAVGFGDGVQSIADKTEALRKAAGEKLGGLRDTLDQAGAGVDTQALADRVEQELGNQPASLRGVASKMQDEADALRGLGQTPLADGGGVMQRPVSLSDIAAERGGYGKQINWGQRNADPSTESFQKLYGMLSDAENDAAQKANPELAQQYLSAKNDYHLLNEAAGTSEDRALRNQANRLFTPTDNLHAAAAIASGHGLLAPVAAVANHVLKGRAASASAVVARGLAKTLGKVGAVAATNPARLGQFGGVLAAALARGKQDFNSTHFVLSSNPEYQKTVSDLQDGPESSE